MASQNYSLNTWYAKRIIGDASAASDALLQLTNNDTLILTNNRASLYGIKYIYDSTTNGTADKIEFYGGNTNTPSAWIQLDTGDLYVLGNAGFGDVPDGTHQLYVVGTTKLYGNVGIGNDASNTYKLYVNGTTFHTNHIYIAAAKHIYMSYNSTNYNILYNHNNGDIRLNAASAGLYIAYENTTFVNWMNGRMELRDGCLSLFPNNGSYREGLRIHATGSWSDITLCGNDNTGNSGTSANSWLIGNNNGNFYISRNGSSSGTSWLGCVDNVWKLYGDQTNSKSKQQSILHIYGPTCGNTAADMISGTAGLFSWGDGGPQITFDTNATPGGAQAGALIFTNNDTAAAGVSWHFVSNQSDWNVTSKRFHARTSISIGQDLPNTSYNLYVNGTSYLNGVVSSTGNITIANTSPHLYLQNTTWTKGTQPTENSYSGVEFITNGTYNNNLRVGMIESNIDTSNNVWLNIWAIPNASGSTSWSGIRLKKTSANVLTIYNQGNTEVSGTITASNTIHANGGYLKSTLNSNTVQIGSQNTNFCHIYNSANIPFIFNKSVLTTAGNLGNTTYPWNNLYIGKDDGAGIYYTTSNYTACAIKFLNHSADQYGIGIKIGGGGVTIIGGGESADTIISNVAPASSSEVIYITSDNNIEFYPAQQNSYDAAAHHTINANGFWAGIDGNTTRETNVGVRSGAGTMYMYSVASASGNRGIYVQPHGTGAAKNVFVVDTNNNVTFNGALNGNASTASSWKDARTLTIGNKGQSVSGSGDVSWTLNDILYNATTLGTATSWDQVGPSVYYVASSTAFTGTNHPGNNSEQAPYTYGQLIVSRAGNGGILQVYASHHASNSGAINEGLRYRTGWNNGGWQAWSTILDDRLWRKYIFANKNIGRSTLTVVDSTWNVTSGTDVFGLSFKDTGLTYTPSGGSATASSDTGDWRAWLTCAAASNTVTLNMRIDGTWQASGFIGPLTGNVTGNCSGSSGSCTGNAATATALTSNAGNANTPVYFTGGKPSACNNKLGAEKANGYWGMGAADNAFNVWIRTTTLGIIPYQSGAIGAGHCGLGTSSWFFSTSYIDAMHTHQLIVEGATNATMTAASTNPRITFQENTGTQPVHLLYCDWDSYRAPAGLKVIGGTSATPAWFEVEGHVYASAVHSAVWNDYAECRHSNELEPGRCVTETSTINGMMRTTERLMPGCKLVSDTYGTLMGETDKARTPIAVSGRVLAYPYRAKEEYSLGAAVCSAPNGTIDIMTRDEIMMYPERIVGTVSEIPDYEVWHGGAQDGKDDIQVNGRIWIYVR